MNQIDWNGFEEALFNYAAKEIELFAAEHQSEVFHGFMFDCNAYYGNVLLCLSSQEELERQLNAEERCGILTDLDDLRWNCGDWSHMDLGTKDETPWSTPWLQFESLILEAQEWEDEDEDGDSDNDETEGCESDADSEVRARRFMESACRVLVRLEISGAFQNLRRTPDFVVLAADHDEVIAESIFRFLSIRVPLLANLPEESRQRLGPQGDLKAMSQGYFALAAEPSLQRDYSTMADRVQDAIRCDPTLQTGELHPIPDSSTQLPIPLEKAAARSMAARAALLTSRETREKWDLLQGAIELEPDCADHHFQLAYLLVCVLISKKEQSVDELAGREFQRAIDLDGSRPIYFVERAKWHSDYRLQPDLSAAIQDLSKALELRPRHYYWRLLRASLHERVQDWRGAVEDYNTALRIRDESGRPRNQLSDCQIERANCLAELGEVAAARDEFTRMLENCRADWEKIKILEHRAKMHELLGEASLAQSDVAAAVALKK